MRCVSGSCLGVGRYRRRLNLLSAFLADPHPSALLDPGFAWAERESVCEKRDKEREEGRERERE